MACKIAISLPEELLAYVDVLTHRWKTTRSGAIAHVLARFKQDELHQEMKDGYIALADIHRQDAELLLTAQSEVLLRED